MPLQKLVLWLWMGTGILKSIELRIALKVISFINSPDEVLWDSSILMDTVALSDQLFELYIWTLYMMMWRQLDALAKAGALLWMGIGIFKSIELRIALNVISFINSLDEVLWD